MHATVMVSGSIGFATCQIACDGLSHLHKGLAQHTVGQEEGRGGGSNQDSAQHTTPTDVWFVYGCMWQLRGPGSCYVAELEHGH